MIVYDMYDIYDVYDAYDICDMHDIHCSIVYTDMLYSIWQCMVCKLMYHCIQAIRCIVCDSI